MLLQPTTPATPKAADHARKLRRLIPAASFHARFMRSSFNGGATDRRVPPNQANRREHSLSIEVRGDTRPQGHVKSILREMAGNRGIPGLTNSGSAYSIRVGVEGCGRWRREMTI